MAFTDGSMTYPDGSGTAGLVLARQEYQRSLERGTEATLPDRWFTYGKVLAYGTDMLTREVPQWAMRTGLGRITLLSMKGTINGWQDRFGVAAELSESGEEISRHPDLQRMLAILDDPSVAATKPLARSEPTTEMAREGAALFKAVQGHEERESTLPWVRRYRYDGVRRIDPGYRDIAQNLRTSPFLPKRLREAFEEGFAAGAEVVGLSGLKSGYARRLLAYAPRRIDGMPFQTFPIEEEPGRFVVRCLTQYGTVITTVANEEKPVYKLPIDSDAMHEHWRARTVRVLATEEWKEVECVAINRVNQLIEESSAYRAPQRVG